MSQKSETDRIEVIENLIGMALALAERLDPMLAAMIGHSTLRIDELKANRSTLPNANHTGGTMFQHLRS